MNWAAALLLLASAEELYRTGVELFQKGRREEAAAALTEAARLAPRNAQIWKALGVVYASAEDYERAEEPFEKACSLAPDLPDACYFLGRNRYALNRFTPAREALEKALPRDRSPWRVRLGLAQADEALGNAGEAERQYLASIRDYAKLPANARGSPDFDPRVHFAVFLFRQGRLQEALKPAAAAVEDNPDSARARYEFGRVLYHNDRLAEAAKEFERALSLGFGEPARLMLSKTKFRLDSR